MGERQTDRKYSERKQGRGTAKGKKKGTGIWTEMEKKAAGTEEKRERGSRAEKEKSGQQQDGDGEKKLGWSTGQRGT